MTIADAFNEITIAQGGTPNYSGTIAAAIDSLNDALAGSDQPAETTIEGAVRLLGQHIGGGGGGGSFGPLQSVMTANVQPEIGGSIDDGYQRVYEISSGENVYARGIGGVVAPIAAGLTAVSFAGSQYTECDAYVCGVDENYEYTSVTPWDGTVTVGSMEQGGDQYATYTLTVPELDFNPETGTGEYLVLYVHEA